jgi:hypothetical protein
MLRIICSGSRFAGGSHVEFIGSKLLPIVRRDLGVLAHGAAPGVDSIVAEAAAVWGWQVKPVPARWTECDLTVPEDLGGCPDWVHRKPRRDGSDYCPRAGWRRNQRLADLTPRADYIVTFPDQRGDKSGTGDLIRRARRAGYDPQEHPIEVVMRHG